MEEPEDSAPSSSEEEDDGDDEVLLSDDEESSWSLSSVLVSSTRCLAARRAAAGLRLPCRTAEAGAAATPDSSEAPDPRFTDSFFTATLFSLLLRTWLALLLVLLLSSPLLS
jgi:hypothetical protein